MTGEPSSDGLVQVSGTKRTDGRGQRRTNNKGALLYSSSGWLGSLSQDEQRPPPPPSTLWCHVTTGSETSEGRVGIWLSLLFLCYTWAEPRLLNLSGLLQDGHWRRCSTDGLKILMIEWFPGSAELKTPQQCQSNNKIPKQDLRRLQF